MADILVLFERDEKVNLTILPQHIEKMKQAAEGDVFWYKQEEEVLADSIDAEILFFWGGTRKPPMAFIERSQKLNWLHTFSTGVDPIIDSPVVNMDVTVTNSEAAHSAPMATAAMGYIISLMRDFPLYARKQYEHVWKKESDKLPRDVQGKTLVILGDGPTAGYLARLAEAFEMVVEIISGCGAGMYSGGVVQKESFLDEALGRADAVVCLIPGRPDTVHFLNADRFSAMKDSAYFINISRGSVIDEAALTAALVSGNIAGAALDVLEDEPLPVGSPLWDMSNVIITPHTAADSVSLMDHCVEYFCDLVRCYNAGEKLTGVVDMDKYR